jgi:hypothetical protein
MVTESSTTEVTEEWVTNTRGQPQHCSPAVGSYVYVGGLGSAVTAIDPNSGDDAWTFDRTGALSDSSPAVANGSVYIGSGGGILYALAESNGDVRWTHTTDSAITSSPAVGNGRVYVGTNDGRVFALGSDSGDLKWETSVGTATVQIDASSAETVTLRKLWTDWTVTVDDPAGGTTDHSVSEAGELTLQWDTLQGSVSPSVTIAPPGETYVGGSYTIEVVASGDGSATDTALVVISDSSASAEVDEP